jgi:hypothetical protein
MRTVWQQAAPAAAASSHDAAGGEDSSCVQLLLSLLRVQWLTRLLRSLFLPVGFPASVTADYAPFQLYDSIQGLCSYLRGMLCTQAVMTGLGVGDATATAASAAMQWLLRDGIGMIGGILFAWRQSARFGLNIRKWRLFADVINDVGLTLEMISPLFPPRYFLWFAGAGSVCRSMCGVAAGASRAALTAHFARKGNNLSDISTKENLQETAVTLSGLVLGTLLAPMLNASAARLWTFFITLTLVHVLANYAAMRVLVLTSFNRQRAELVVRHVLLEQQQQQNDDDNALNWPSPQTIAAQDGIFACRSSSNATANSGILLRFGCSFREYNFASVARDDEEAEYCFARYRLRIITRKVGRKLCALLYKDVTPRHVLEAFVHCVALQWHMQQQQEEDQQQQQQPLGELVRACAAYTRLDALAALGWRIDHVSLGDLDGGFRVLYK